MNLSYNISNKRIIEYQNAKQWNDLGLLEISKINKENLSKNLQLIKSSIDNYLPQLDSSYKEFQRYNHIEKLIKSISKEEKQNKESQLAKVIQQIGEKKYRNRNKATKKYISTLMIGWNMAQHIRQLFTGQNIATEVTIQISKTKSYRIPLKELNPEIVLSTYGATVNSVFSLAYDFKNIIKNLTEEQKLKYSISSNDIYKQIWNVKKPYLEQKTLETNKKYRPFFNSKDAEIFDLMTQLGTNPSWLTVEKYGELCKQMGGSGGHHTTSLQAGDVNLIQDKLATKNQTVVNFGRHSLIRGKLTKLSEAIGTGRNTIIEQKIKEIFTEKEELLINELKEQSNKEAINFIENLFR